jgi:signal transduction histidine kinase
MGWHLVLARDGTVVAATDGAPASWIGTRLEACPEAPEDLRLAAAGFLSGESHSHAPVSTAISLQSTGETVSLTVIDALPLRRGPTNLTALLRSSLESMVPQAAAAEVTLKIAVESDVPGRIDVDGDKIAWVVTALVGNALRYVRPRSMMMPGGTIIVRAAFNSVSREVVVEVQDDGPGIPEDRLPTLFDPRPDGPRRALGLQMVREVVAAHGGSLEVDSQTEAFMSGTIVRLMLPV